ncbi:MAG: helix-turn-helix transcriptional regulator [Thermoplasmata archaeon]|nr:helix-turn-helix transcriptional regulator [Thermoplasmata archaeon]
MQGEEITRLLMDEYAMKILMAAYNEEINALGISRDYEIPIAACYRRIHSLEEVGLIQMAEERVGAHGKKIRNYRAAIKSATITFIHGQMVVRLTFTTGETKTMTIARSQMEP